MHFFHQDIIGPEYSKAYLYLSKHISELIEKNTNQKIFYKILAARDGILYFNHFDTINEKELISLANNYKELLMDNDTYINEEEQILQLKTDNYHKLTCHRRLLQIYTKLISNNQNNSYHYAALNHIQNMEKLITKIMNSNYISIYYNTIGDFYLVDKNYQQAITYFIKARDIESAKNNSYEKINYQLAYAYDGLAHSYINIKKYSLAKENIEKCLKIRETLYNSDHPLLLETQKNMTLILNLSINNK
jgi:tetratricopeptide (TPR) repeat protein